MNLLVSCILIISHANALNESKFNYFYVENYINNKKTCLMEIDSEMKCFYNDLNFTMGTNEPVFKNDGEAPARLVNVRPFCIDKTEVSNFQFMLFQMETSYITEVY
jgi:hypothetical protein